jgi:hypothetical protein
MLLKSRAVRAVAVAAAEEVGLVEGARCCTKGVDSGWDCSLAAGTVLGVGSSNVVQVLACRHDCWRWWVSAEAQANGCARQGPSFAVEAEGEVDRRTWRSAVRNSVAVEPGLDPRQYAHGLVGWWSGQHLLPATTERSGSWSRSRV